MNKILRFTLAFILPFFLVSCFAPEDDDVTIELNPGVDTVEINTEFIDSGATSKAFGFKVDNEVIYDDVDITAVGTYHIVYEVEYKSVTKTITRIVNVVDETPPTGNLNAGIDTISVGSSWVDASVTVFDNSLGDVTITVSGNVNSNIAGEYIITYILEDPSGNQSSIERYVFVIE